MTARKPLGQERPETQEILRHWHDVVPNDRLAHLVKDATRALIRALQMRLTEHDVSFGHWAFLRILWETDGLTQKQLSTQAGLMEPTTFAAVKAMEKLGYVVRQQLPENKKNVHVFLTEEGRRLKGVLIPLAVEVNEVSVRGLKDEEVEIARRVLLTVIENLANAEASSINPSHRMPSTREVGRMINERGESTDTD
ncbi:MarR family transcriptional regulator [Pseudomonas agarici]|uniref:MarR family transcriptional regulator n=1 Tax=Pseudomonas agarici TaxID=46677 RepID=A0A0X1T899_PSEAA|nr:MarR family transcriptional regulator [Pseudomonas agarici]AMB88335.1 MarR family transcriptional regulator [Pseudomonas agarici]NWC09798.1 MarR family transcriptional regulator [Pseudomonas agarici]SEL30306.1 DNA-binding transcriptional regulator, MarR family [Pseudomonas agarici]